VEIRVVVVEDAETKLKVNGLEVHVLTAIE